MLAMVHHIKVAEFSPLVLSLEERPHVDIVSEQYIECSRLTTTGGMAGTKMMILS